MVAIGSLGIVTVLVVEYFPSAELDFATVVVEDETYTLPEYDVGCRL